MAALAPPGGWEHQEARGDFFFFLGFGFEVIIIEFSKTPSLHVIQMHMLGID